MSDKIEKDQYIHAKIIVDRYEKDLDYRVPILEKQLRDAKELLDTKHEEGCIYYDTETYECDCGLHDDMDLIFKYIKPL